MKKQSYYLLFLITVLATFLISCSETEPQPETEEIPPAPTAETNLPPVNLIAPLPGRESDGAAITLEWNWLRKLNPNEKYDVRVWKEGNPELGITLTSQPYLNLENWLVYQEAGTYNWRVFVVQTEGDQQVRIITPAGEQRQFTVAAVDNPAANLTVPEGFTTKLIATVPSPTTMAMDDNGTLFVATLGGDILAQAADARGSDEFETFASGFNIVTGIMAHDGELYISSNGLVSVLKDTNNDLISDERRELFEPDVLPGRQYDSHSNNGMSIGPDGFLYIPIGSTTDHGPIQHPLEGTMLKYNLETAVYEVFAEGLRNPYDTAFDANGNLYVSDNGPDAPDANLLSVPPDEINLVQEGKHYGFPDYFGAPPPDTGTETPMILVPASSAVTGMIVYDGENFPDEYDQAIFVSLWGNATINHPTGHRVSVATRAEDGTYHQEDFVDFVWGMKRPIEVIQTIDDTLMVADFEAGRIFEIEYTK